MSEIVLNAVGPGAQRSGVYQALLQNYLKLASARGDREAMISTQLQNYHVRRAWTRAGFHLFRSYHTLHRWTPT
jgi:GNAT superfamily N-acetyltransferase